MQHRAARRGRDDDDHRQVVLNQGDRAVLKLTGGEALRVDVGQFLELQCTLERDREADVAPQEEHGLDRSELLGELLDRLSERKGLFDLGGQLGKRVVDVADLVGIHRATRLGQRQADHVVRRDLREEGLGGGHADLRAGVGVEHRVGFARDLGTVGITHRQHPRSLGLGVAHGLQGVGGLTGLGDGDDEGLLVQHRVAVAELGCDLDLHRDAGPVLDGVLRQQPGVVGGTTGDDVDLLDVAEVVVGEALLVEDDLAVDEAAGQGVADGGGLLVDFLHHEGVEAVLLGGLLVPVDGERAALGRGAVEVHDLVIIGRDRDGAVLAELDGVLGVGDEGGDVRTKEHAVLPDPDDQRGVAATGDDEPRCVNVGEQDGERTFQAAQDGERGGLDVPGVLALVVFDGEQVGGDLGVRVGDQLDAAGLELVAQGGEVLDDAVVDDGGLAVEGEVRVRVDVVRAAVGGPAGVSQAGVAGQGVATNDVDAFDEVAELALGFFYADTFCVIDGDTGGIVSPVLHPPQCIEPDFQGLLLSYVSNDCAHKWKRYTPAWPMRKQFLLV